MGVVHEQKQSHMSAYKIARMYVCVKVLRATYII